MGEENVVGYSELLDEMFEVFLSGEKLPYSVYRKFQEFQMIAVEDHRNILKRIRTVLSEDGSTDSDKLEYVKKIVDDSLMSTGG